MGDQARTHAIVDSPLGELTLVNTDGVLSALYMAEHARRPDAVSFGERTRSGFEDVTVQLSEYFAGQRTEFTLPVAPVGSEFQRQVWQRLRQIPYGQTRSYTQLADELGNRLVIRAVGAANGRNPISIIIPCHRVIGADGSLTGYAGGLARKQYLLAMENPARSAQEALF